MKLYDWFRRRPPAATDAGGADTQTDAAAGKPTVKPVQRFQHRFTQLAALRQAHLPSRKTVLLAAGATVLAGAVSVLVCSVPAFDSVRQGSHSSEALLLDRHGTVLESLRLDQQKRMLSWVSLDQISPAMQDAILAAEDKRFYSHPGVDPAGILAAINDNLHRRRARGASTISMQLARLLYMNDESASRGWIAKLRQLRYALAIELHWNKRQIFEAYLNLVPFRGELTGIDAAARGLLTKGPGGLNLADSALLAALVREPGASRNAIARRACSTLKAIPPERLAKQGETTAALCERSAFLASALPRHPYPIRGSDEAPHLARKLLKHPGERLQVALDADLQRFARETLRTHLAQLSKQNVEDGAVVVIDNASGEVLAYVGSSGDLSGSPEVDGVAALRQPGSTLKPFLYGLAIDQGWLNASSVLDDSPLALTTPSGLYIPQDYDRQFHGAVSVRTALGSSLNVPAVRTLTLVGVDRFLNLLRELGMNTLTREADHYGFGLALGGAETTLLQLSNAYRTLANGGQWRPTRFLPSEATNTAASVAAGSSPAQQTETQAARQILSPQASFIIADILADPVARTMTFGMSSPLSTRTWTAVKTGTSKAMRDNWAVGFSDRYTVGVWVGNFSGAPMWDVSGVTGAAPVWRDVMEYLHRSAMSRPPAVPPGVSAQHISYRPPVESPRQDWVIARNGSVPEHVVIQIDDPLPALIAPANSAIIAPDPDIPEKRQALLLHANGAGRTCLRLDNKPVAACGVARLLVPLPSPGTHILSLHDSKGKLLDSHTFEVRGLQAPPRKAASR